MAEVSCVLLALLLTASLCPAQELAKPKPNEITGEEGKEVTFSLRYSGPRTEVVWKIGEDKLVEVDENEPYYYRLKERASVTFNPGDLTIRDLVESDSGNYRGSYLQDGKYHETEFTLKVSPSKPHVNYTVTETKVRLHCHSNSTGVTYQWMKISREFLSSEPVHEIDKKKEGTNESLICIVRNKHADISNTLIIHIPPPPPPIPVWIIVLVIAIVIVIVVVGGVIYFFFYKKGKCPNRDGDKAENRTTSGNSAEGEQLYPGGTAAENGKTPGKAEGFRDTVKPDRDVEQRKDDRSNEVTEL